MADNKLKCSKELFSKAFKEYCKVNEISREFAEQKIADDVDRAKATVHDWACGRHDPSVDVKKLAKTLQVDYTSLVKERVLEDNKMVLTEKQCEAVKRIYDKCIWFLAEFLHSDGFSTLCIGKKNAVDVYDEIEQLSKELEIVVDQEYFYLKNTPIYDELTVFVNESIISLYDGKLDKGARYDDVEEGRPTAFDDYSKAYKELNQIIDKYIYI